jgi:hypothetical protein
MLYQNDDAVERNKMLAARWSNKEPSLLKDMLKILEPFWNRVLLVCSKAPLKKGSRNFHFPKNGVERAMCHRGLILTSYGTFLTRWDFPSGGGKFGFFFRQKAQDVCWEKVPRTPSPCEYLSQ